MVTDSDKGADIAKSTIVSHGTEKGGFGYHTSLRDNPQNLFQEEGFEEDDYRERQIFNHRADLQLTSGHRLILATSYVDDLKDDIIKMHDRLDLSISATIMVNSNPASAQFIMEDTLTGGYSGYQENNVQQRQAYISIKIEYM